MMRTAIYRIVGRSLVLWKVVVHLPDGRDVVAFERV